MAQDSKSWWIKKINPHRTNQNHVFDQRIIFLQIFKSLQWNKKPRKDDVYSKTKKNIILIKAKKVKRKSVKSDSWAYLRKLVQFLWQPIVNNRTMITKGQHLSLQERKPQAFIYFDISLLPVCFEYEWRVCWGRRCLQSLSSNSLQRLLLFWNRNYLFSVFFSSFCRFPYIDVIRLIWL